MRKSDVRPTVDQVRDTLQPATRQNVPLLIRTVQKEPKINRRRIKRPRPIPLQPKAVKRRHVQLDVLAK